jgi:hypothetical protein
VEQSGAGGKKIQGFAMPPAVGDGIRGAAHSRTRIYGRNSRKNNSAVQPTGD